MAEDTIVPNTLSRYGGMPRFTVGDAVRVRAGVADPDFTDIPLGGWTGRVADIDPTAQPPLYLVRWNRETLAAIPAVYRVRCEREDLHFEECWLGEADLEPDPGGPLKVVVPTGLRPAPLDLTRPEDRVRAIFGLTTDDPLPPIDEASLRRFYDHFQKRLKLPASVRSEVADSGRRLVLQRLLSVEEADEDGGLLAEVRFGGKSDVVPLADLSLPGGGAAAQDLEAYAEWIVNGSGNDTGVYSTSPVNPRLEVLFSPELLLLQLLLACVLLGGLLGAVLWTVDSAPLAGEVGAGLLGVLGFILGRKGEGLIRRLGAQPGVSLTGALLGLLAGAVVGGAAGIVATAYRGAIPGLIAGAVLGQLLTAVGVRAPAGRLPLLGVYIGSMTYAFLLDTQQALAGCTRCACVSVGLFVLAFLLVRLLLVRRG